MTPADEGLGTSEILTTESAAKKLESLFDSADAEQPKAKEPHHPAPTAEEAPVEETEEPPAEEEPEPEVEDDSEQELDPEAEPVDDETPEESDAPETETLHDVKTDGKVEKVSLDELKKGYSRQSDYTKKTTDLAEQRKEFTALKDKELSDVRTVRQTYGERLETVQEALTALMPPEPNWAQLETQLSPAEYAAVYTDFKTQQERVGKIQAERNRVAQEHSQELLQQSITYLNKEREQLIAAVPEWREPEQMKAGLTALKAKVQKVYGLSDAALDSVVDHHAVLIMRDALKYREASTSTKVTSKIKEAMQPATPGARADAKPKHALTKARQRLAQTHKAEDAASVIEHLLSD